MSKQAGIKVYAPASVGNVAVGFDIMGLALHTPGDEIVIHFSDKPGLRITAITGAGGKLPLDPEKNTAGVAALRLIEHLKDPKLGFEIELHKKIPIGSGLGSSAASAVAGALAVNELLKRPLDKKELLTFALQGEQLASGSLHADNVAPSLLGGLLLIRDHQTLDIQRLPVPKGLFVTVVHPNVQVFTKEARSILSPAISMKEFIAQTANACGFLTGLFNSDFELLGRSLQDVVIEQQRASLIPHFYEVKEAVLSEGALGCSISGAGPSIFALAPNSLIAENIGAAMQRVFNDGGIQNSVFVSTINQEGAVKR